MLKRVYLSWFIGVVLAAILTGCKESSFELAPESRLPKWFDVPEGLTRDDLRVRMDYYTDGNAIFNLYQKDRNLSLKTVKGFTRGDQPIALKNPPPGYPKHYPMYQVITVGNKIEVIEHRKMEPVFYITDDPSVLEEVGVKR